MKKNISISGLAGAGKTTIGELLARKMGYNFLSIGNYTRQFAYEKYKLNINQFQDYRSTHLLVDEQIDKSFSEYINLNCNLVVDYRLAYFFTDNCFNIYLEVSEEEAVRRLCNSKRISEFEEFNIQLIKQTMNSRNEKMRHRFLSKYNTDFTLKSNFDLIINTDTISDLNEIVSIIQESYSKK
jgi:cytidylate kinase